MNFKLNLKKKKKSLYLNKRLQYIQIAVWLKNLFKELYRDWIFQEGIFKKAKQEVMKIYLDEESLKFAWGLMGCPNPYKLQQSRECIFGKSLPIRT